MLIKTTVRVIRKCTRRYSAVSLIDSTDVKDLNLLKDVHVMSDAITKAEHETLVRECERSLKRRRYETGHWDGVIESFREITKRDWTLESRKVFERLIESDPVEKLELKEFLPPHVLDLSKDGFIKPHIDSIIASGQMVAGISLLSPAVMVLSRESESLRILLPPRSFYVLSGTARFEFKHEILPGTTKWTDDSSIVRDRRISIILRDEIRSDS